MNSVLEKIADLLPCKQYENYLATNCIFHDDTSPSLLIYETWYSCQSCGAKGKTSKLLTLLEGKTVKPSQKSLYPHLWGKFGIDGNIEDLAYEAHFRLKLRPDDGFYLKQRGIFSEIEKLKIGLLNGWFIFPIIDEFGNVTGLIARAGIMAQSTYKMRYMTPPKQVPTLYVPDWNKIRTDDHIILVFGIIDAITLFKLGYPAVSGSTGHNISVDLFKPFRKKIYILPDGDHADDKNARELARQLDWRGKLKFIDYPDSTKDMNKVYCKYGESKIKTLLGDIK